MELLTHMIDRAVSCFQSAFGWFLALMTGFVAWLGDERMSLVIILLAVAWDLIWGIAKSVKRKQFVLSRLIRATIGKVLVYCGSLLFVLMCERSLNSEWGILTRIVAVISACIELYSACGNMLIIYPNMPFLRFFRGQLIGEIADKLHISSEEAEKELEKKNKKKHDKQESD